MSLIPLADELVNLNEVSVQLNGVQLGKHNVYAVAKSDRNHVASSVLSLQVVPEKTPTDSTLHVDDVLSCFFN